MSRDSSVGVVTRLWAARAKSCGSISDSDKGVVFSATRLDWSWFPPGLLIFDSKASGM